MNLEDCDVEGKRETAEALITPCLKNQKSEQAN
jgi:hypothetical protein